jgi:hypothetical protein
MALRGDDDPRDVEFLAVTDTSWRALDDEASVRRPEPGGPPGVRRAVIAAAVVVIGGALVLRTATSHDVQRHAAGSTPIAVVLPPVVHPSVILGQGPLPVIVATDPLSPDHCPSTGGSCTVSDGLPAAFLDAVRAKLGTVVPTQQLDVDTGSNASTFDTTPWYRQLTAKGDGPVTIVVTVSTVAASISTSSVTQSPTAVTGHITHPTGTGYLVELEMTGPPGWSPPMDAMTALAADPRLLVKAAP